MKQVSPLPQLHPLHPQMLIAFNNVNMLRTVNNNLQTELKIQYWGDYSTVRDAAITV